jgi:O-Antigen ligase
MKGHLRAALGRDLLSTAPAAALASGIVAALVAMVLFKLGPPQHQLKAGLGVVGIGVIVTAALRPVFALGFVVALMPFEYKVYGLGTDEVLILGAAAILMWRIEARRVPWWVALSSFAVVMGSFLTVVGAHDPGSALWGAARWLGALLLLAAAFSILHGRPDVNRRLMDIIVCSAVVVVAFALLQRAGIYVIVAAPYQAGQISATFGYYTVYGGFVGMAAVLATGEILYSLTSGQRSRAILFAVGLTIILLGVAISLSRGALLCAGAGWIVLLILNARRASLVVKGIALVIVFIAAAYVATPPQTRTALVNRFSTPVGSQVEDQQRFALQAAGRHALAHHPNGLGYGNFSYYLASHPASGANAIFFHSHQLLTQVGLDAGWLGLAGFIALLAGALIVAVRVAPLPGGVRNTAFAAALCGLMAQGLYDYLFYEISMLALWVVLIFGAAQIPVRARSSGPA